MAVRLPHPELSALAREMKRRVSSTRQVEVAGTRVTYQVFEHDRDVTWLAVAYDEDGTIYVADELVGLDERYADLSALHEYEEIRHKRAGRSHAYAHRSAYVAELVAASEVFDDPDALAHYLDWRIGGYPASKVPNPCRVARQLTEILTGDTIRKGALRQEITLHRL
jgi:hypothetical protein